MLSSRATSLPVARLESISAPLCLRFRHDDLPRQERRRIGEMERAVFCSLLRSTYRQYPMERTVTLASKSGLHARPAALFVQRAKAFQSQIALSKNGKTANGKSILAVMALGAGQGEQITLSAEGDDAQLALDSLAALLEENLG